MYEIEGSFNGGLSNAIMVTDCPKFSPNIFNTTKCSTCFKTREEHGDVALDSKVILFYLDFECVYFLIRRLIFSFFLILGFKTGSKMRVLIYCSD